VTDNVNEVIGDMIKEYFKEYSPYSLNTWEDAIHFYSNRLQKSSLELDKKKLIEDQSALMYAIVGFNFMVAPLVQLDLLSDETAKELEDKLQSCTALFEKTTKVLPDDTDYLAALQEIHKKNMETPFTWR